MLLKRLCKRVDKYTFQNVLCLLQLSLLRLQVGLLQGDYIPHFCPNIRLHNGRMVASLFLPKYSCEEKTLPDDWFLNQDRSLSMEHKMQKTRFSTCQSLSSVAQSCLTLCSPTDCSTPGLSVNHHLPEVAQTHVHWVGDAIQPSHPLSSSSPPALNLSQHQGRFKWVSSLHQNQSTASGGQSTGVSASASVLPMNIQDWFTFGLTGLIFLQSKGLSRVFNTKVQKHQFFCAQLSLQSNSHIHTWLLEKL